METSDTRVLIVEDNSDDLIILERLFARLGQPYQLVGAPTGADALERVRRQTWDLAFVDQHLPDVRGEALIGLIREVDPTLPVVMLTGLGDEQLAVNAMKAGAWDYLRKGELNTPLLQKTIHSVEQRARDEAKRRASQAELQEMAIRDGLTGVCNHRHFQSLLVLEFARARRYGQRLACLMLDLDRFKRINDSLGHYCGDEVLRQVASVLKGEAREVDVLARYGGEEFVLLLPNTDAEGAVRAGERIRRAVADAPAVLADRNVRLTISVGAATDDAAGVDAPADLVRRADEALYAAKRNGRNQVCLAGSPEVITDQALSSGTPSGRRAASAVATVVAMTERHQQGRAGHGARTAALIARFARRLVLGSEATEVVVAAARLAGLRRIALPEAVWNSSDPLSPADHERVRESSMLAEEIILQAGEREAVATAVRHIGERWDGQGSPDGLAGTLIPRSARVLAVVDAWCALTSDRPWRPAFRASEARMLLVGEAGRAFDPDLVTEFCRLIDLEGTPR